MPTTSSRLLSLLSLLQARRDWPAALLAERLDVSDRTVRRDVDRLRELGYPVTSTRGREGGYRLDAGTQLPPLLFDDEQAVALAVALRTATASGAAVEEAAARALQTVRQLLPARLRHRVDAVQVTVADRMATTSSTATTRSTAGTRDPGPEGRGGLADPAVLDAIGAAARRREVLRFDYRAPAEPPTGPVPPRRAEPHHLVTRGGRWYLVAWDLDRADWRTFRADRIALRTPNGPRFARREVPGGDVIGFVTGRFRGAEDGGDWPCRGELVVHAPVAEVAPFAYDGVVEALGPDRCRLQLGAWSWAGLAAAAARFDAELEVVGPRELVDACTRLAGRFARAAGSAAGERARSGASPGSTS
ncbi:helix-turn-helix transcriptional regulator [Cellulomonas sp. Marseille-Q8402]